jgi:WD40 repeat protein
MKLAITTTNKKILFFEFTSKKEELKIELNTPTLQKKIWYLPEHGLWVSSGISEDKKDINNDKSFLKSTRRGESKRNMNEKKITEETLKSRNERFNLYEIEIEFENRNNQKLEVYYDPGGNPFRSVLCEHPDEILDVIEIRKPQLILTACMDKIIRLINTNDKTTLITWTDHHKSGIRCLDYNYNIGAGYIISVGFEYFINVWSPEVSIKDAFKGKLEGHYSPVIMCKFLSGSPMCVSVDEEGNLRIWDTRKLLCLQLIPQEKKNFRVNKLLSMPKYNKFILYGNKIIFYDPKYRQTDIKPKQQKSEEYYPIRVDFNQYYLNFYVTTQKDVRIYNKDGTLKKVFKNLKNNADGAKIKFFLFEKRHRKFYLGFSSGAIQQFNAGNGSLIKKIGEYEDEKDGISCIKHDHSSDVTNLFFNEEDQILISTGLDSLINIYDESNSEETQKLRTVKGGHKIAERNNQIFALDFSNHLNLFATGSTDGLITVWDFELSKIDDICYIEKNNDKVMDVYSLKFLEPFPILVSSYSDGSIYFWGVKPNFTFRSRSFLRVKNNTMQNMKEEYSPVLSMVFIYADMEDIPIKKRIKKKVNETTKDVNSDNKTSWAGKLKESVSK